MTFARLPVNIWRRQCLWNIIPRQPNRTKLLIHCPVACSRAIFTAYNSSFCLFPCLSSWVPVLRFDTIAVPGVSPGSCWVCGAPWSGYWEEKRNPAILTWHKISGDRSQSLRSRFSSGLQAEIWEENNVTLKTIFKCVFFPHWFACSPAQELTLSYSVNARQEPRLNPQVL